MADYLNDKYENEAGWERGRRLMQRNTEQLKYIGRCLKADIPLNPNPRLWKRSVRARFRKNMA